MDHLDPKQNWGAEEWRKPSIPEAAIPLCDECGRILRLEGRKDGIDYRSHYFRLYQDGNHGRTILAVRHGGGEQHISLGYDFTGHKQIAALLPSDLRYLYFHALYDTHSNARESGLKDAAAEYRKAFADGRLKKRNLNGRDACRIWIEAEPVVVATSH